MRVFGEVIAEARRKANLTQRQLAALIKTEEGRGISGPYMNDIEHSLRHPPRGFLLQQLAKLLDLDVELLYLWRIRCRSMSISATCQRSRQSQHTGCSVRL